jgi:hypothetical protein
MGINITLNPESCLWAGGRINTGRCQPQNFSQSVDNMTMSSNMTGGNITGGNMTMGALSADL